MDKSLSGKQLLRKASSKIAAKAFLETYQNHIREAYPETIATLDSWSKGESADAPTLDTIKKVVATHLLENMRRNAEEAIARAHKRGGNGPKAPKGESGSGRYACQFFVKNVNERTGESKVDLYTNKDGVHTFNAETYQAAQNLVDRTQNEMTNSVYATITNKNGKQVTTTIIRDDSIARHNKKRSGPAVQNRGMGLSKSLKNFISCKQDTCSFSRG